METFAERSRTRIAKKRSVKRSKVQVRFQCKTAYHRKLSQEVTLHVCMRTTTRSAELTLATIALDHMINDEIIINGAAANAHFGSWHMARKNESNSKTVRTQRRNKFERTINLSSRTMYESARGCMHPVLGDSKR